MHPRPGRSTALTRRQDWGIEHVADPQLATSAAGDATAMRLGRSRSAASLGKLDVDLSNAGGRSARSFRTRSGPALLLVQLDGAYRSRLYLEWDRITKILIYDGVKICCLARSTSP